MLNFQALLVEPNKEYNVHWPIRRGRLNVHEGPCGTLTSVLSDLELIWGYAIQNMLDIPLKDLKVNLPLFEPLSEKTNNLGFRPGLTQISLYSHKSRLEAFDFGLKKKRDCTIRVAKTKALIRFMVTAKLVCAFVFAYTDCWFSHSGVHLKKKR